MVSDMLQMLFCWNSNAVMRKSACSACLVRFRRSAWHCSAQMCSLFLNFLLHLKAVNDVHMTSAGQSLVMMKLNSPSAQESQQQATEQRLPTDDMHPGPLSTAHHWNS